jgi:hypothetical protein
LKISESAQAMGRELHNCECAVSEKSEDSVTVAEHRQINVLLVETE